MAETLLSLSEVLLFGRKVEDLEVRPASKSTKLKATVVKTRPLTHPFKGYIKIDGLRIGADDIVLVTDQKIATQNGRYKVPATATAAWTAEPDVGKGETVFVEDGRKYGQSLWKQTAIPAAQEFSLIETERHRGLGRNRQLDEQLEGDACFAHIYAFSYEGAYYELPWPALFLVHGDGESVTADNAPVVPGSSAHGETSHASRAPTNPSKTGLTAADFQFSDDVKYWSYDKADYTIRMDVETGMFEQVLLDMMFDGDGSGGGMAGASVRGASVRGASVRGASVRGASVRGASVRGASVRGGGGGD